jgi:anti-sigma B factor antagonist
VTAFESSAYGTDSADVPNLTTTTEWHGRSAVLVVSGDVDMVTAPRFEAALLSLVRESPESLVVDLSGVAFFASAGLTALVAAYQQAGDDTAVHVVATNTATRRPLEITALDRRIPVHASQEEALSAH